MIMENKEIEDEEMLVNETSEECDLDWEAKAKQIKERAFKAGYCFGYREAKEDLDAKTTRQIDSAFLRGYLEGRDETADACLNSVYEMLKTRHKGR